MGNGTAVLEPTYTGYVASTHDALILFEACLTGVLHHVPRRPHDRERAQLVRSGSVFIYEENASGIKRWTDGVTWSPSRILGNFLVYRELDKPFPPGEKKRAVKKGARRPTTSSSSSRAGEPYPRLDAAGNPPAYSPPTAAAVVPPFTERGQQSELERALVGSLVDSYGFKDSGLVKKTMSVTVSGVTHHLVSYYSVDDVIRGVLSPPSMVDSLRYIRPRQELTTKQSFRAPIEDPDQPAAAGIDDTDPQAMYAYRPNPMVSYMPTSYYPVSYPQHHPQQHHPQQHHPQQHHQQQPPSVPGYGVAPPQQNPYLQTPATELPVPKTDDYAYRGSYPPFQPQPPPQQQQQQQQPSQQSQAAASVSAYRTPSMTASITPSMAPRDIPTSLDPAVASPSATAYPRSFIDSKPPSQQQQGGQQQQQQSALPPTTAAPPPPSAGVYRRESYYDQSQVHQRRASLQQPPPQPQQPAQSYYSQQPSQSAYQGAPPMSTWNPTHGQPI